MIKTPIWKDTVYQAEGDTLPYVVKVGNRTVWDDVAYKRPQDSHIMIYMNRIAVDFMEGSLALSTGLTSNPGEYAEFKLYKNSGGALSLLETYCFLFDFIGEWEGGDKTLSNPIDGVLDPRMIIPFTHYSESGTDITIE